MARPLKAVLVGCGGISRAWLEAAQTIPDLAIVGLVDLNSEAAQRQAREFALTNALIDTDLPAILTATTPDIVFDCTIPAAHTVVRLTALAHGCHVLGEKPMADSSADAQRMIQAAENAGKLYAVMQQRRYDPNIRRLQAMIASGALGRLTTINSDFYIGAHFRDFRDHLPHVLLLDMAIHTFDAARLLSGADPVAVYCKEWNPSGSWYDRDAAAVAIFEMTDGLIYTYRGSWCAEGRNTTWESDWRIVGERGSATWDGAEEIEAEVVQDAGSFRATYQQVDAPALGNTGSFTGHAAAIRDFIHCVNNNQVPETICTDNIKSLAMVFAAINSAERGQRVEVRW